MIIGSSYAAPIPGMRRVIDTPTFAAPRVDAPSEGSQESGAVEYTSQSFAPRASVAFYPASKSEAAAASSKAAPVDAKPASSGVDRDGQLMRETARIVAAMASMKGVDDMSAYALLGRNDGQTDAHRQMVAAYREASE